LSRRGNVALNGQEAQELRDLGRPHLGGMALAMEEDESADPGDVGLLGAPASVARAERVADAVEQPGLPRSGRRRLFHGEPRFLRQGIRNS
jgi:hypothetical protein